MAEVAETLRNLQDWRNVLNKIFVCQNFTTESETLLNIMPSAGDFYILQ